MEFGTVIKKSDEMARKRQITLYHIEKNYEPRQIYKIWVNPKNLQDFRVKRFSGAISGILIIAVFGGGVLSGLIPLLFKMLRTG